MTRVNKVDKRIIIYGMGEIFVRNQQYIVWENVIALTDGNIKGLQLYNDKIPVIMPEQICQTDFDCLVIFTDKYFDDIKMTVTGKYFVPEEKIMSWRMFLEENIEFFFFTKEFLKNFINVKKIRNILDIGMKHLPGIFLSRKEEGIVSEIQIDGIGEIEYRLFVNNLYNCIFAPYEQIKQRYDLIFLWRDYEEYIDIDKIAEGEARYILLIIPYRVESGRLAKDIKSISYEMTKRYMLPDNIVYEYRKKDKNKSQVKPEKNNLSVCEIFVVMHKKYNVLNNAMYRPLCVGNKYRDEMFLCEKKGDNISYLNEKINECTALYWIWKNTYSDYVGLNHYRRYFYNDGIRNSANYLDMETVCKLFDEGYDIIMPSATMLSVTVYENIRNSVGEDLCDKAYKILKECIRRVFPENVSSFEYVLNGHMFYARNMFITHRFILDKYCQWLFSFLIEAAELLDVSSCGSNQKRTMGYFAETMWTVWLLRQDLKIMELPIVDA